MRYTGVALAIGTMVFSACSGGSGTTMPAAGGALGDAARSPMASGYKLLVGLGPSTGTDPLAGLTKLSGMFYGTTNSGPQGSKRGSIFSVDSSGTYKMIYRFGNGNGSKPYADMIAYQGTLYGTTNRGGAMGKGIVFSVTPAGVEKLLYSFKGGADGANPQGGLAVLGGTLYGTTTSGGSANNGTVFSVSTAGVENVIYSFPSNSQNAVPIGGLLASGNALFGTTSSGAGGVFKITPDGTETVLHAFAGNPDGAMPRSALIASGGPLYGTTAAGGTADGGTVFSITKTGSVRILYSFNTTTGSDGYTPVAGLILANGLFYGTTLAGGKNNYGTVFSVTANGAEKVVYRFQNTKQSGAAPRGGVVFYKGALYGTTSSGEGTIYRVTP
jgi:uncharacterized repeat protein (TIGR03803 family)